MRLILVLGDQLTPGIAALRAGDRATDVVVMAEVLGEATYVPHHPQKIALIFAAMRKHAEVLRADGWTVAYARLDNPDNTQTIAGELIRRAAETGATGVIATEPGEWRVIHDLAALPLRVTTLPDDRFLCSTAEFAAWAGGRKQFRMEWFYRDMRRKTGLLMEGDQPAGGQWNYDHDNRKPAKADLFRATPPEAAPDTVTEEVLALVGARFGGNFGRLRPFRWATDRAGALAALDHFIAHNLADFGTYQDAMLAGDPFLHHAVISPYLNIGLLTPLEVCAGGGGRMESGPACRSIRQRGSSARSSAGGNSCGASISIRGRTMRRATCLGHTRDLPPVYWGAPTKMACMAAAVGQTRDLAYAHHIQRLMVTGNFALLAGVDPGQVHDWYLAVYADAFEWVEAPNTVGMSQFADGGVVGSKPYVSSGAYIDRMSDYCGGCAYSVKDKAGENACPFNLLYWHFLMRHRERFQGNPRMAQMYRTWDRMEEGHRERVLAGAEGFLGRLEKGEGV